MVGTDYQRLYELKEKINSKTATSAEKGEYMLILYRNGNITKQQYDAFVNNQNTEELINAALAIGGMVLLGWLIAKVFSN